MKLSILIVATLATLSLVVCHSRDPKKDPDMKIDFGPFASLNVYYNQTKEDNQIRLSKSYLDMELISRLQSDKLVVVKHSRFDDLKPCDSLDLIAPENLGLFDCKPASAHIVEKSYPEVPSSKYPQGNYVRLSSTRNKWKQFGFSGKRDILLYPLRQSVIDERVKSIVASNDLESLNFSPRSLSLGYYFEGSIGPPRSDNPIVCAGKIFISVNRTQILALSSDDEYPDEISELAFLGEQGLLNGILVSVQDMNCHKPSSNILKFSLDLDFTIISRLQFPYLTVSASIASRPIKQLFQFDAKLNQVQNPITPSLHSYNTSIAIHGSSYLIQGFNFDLDQIWVNEDKNTGWEKMTFRHPYAPIVVDAIWNATNHIKTGRFFDSMIEDIEKTVDKITEAVKIHYTNDQSKDHVTLNLDVRRDYLPLLNWPFDFISGAIDNMEEQNANSDAVTNDIIRDEL